MAIGVVRWWNISRGYGFLRVEDEPDVLIERGALDEPEQELQQGDVISFTPITGNFGRIAANARKEPSREEDQGQLAV